MRSVIGTILAICLVGGCTTAVESGHNTALTGMDLKTMTDQMATSIASNAQVRNAIGARGQLKIVVEPAQNEMTAEILPKGEAEAFTSRVRSLLSSHHAGEFVWIMNRDEFYDLRKTEREDALGPSPEAVDPEYALTAHFRSLTRENSKGRSSAYVCVYDLSNLKDRTVLWSDQYEVEKRAVKGLLD